MTRPSARHVRLIAATELRRRWRSVAGNTAQLVATAVVGLFYLLLIAGGAVAGYAAGRALAAGDVATPLRYARYAAGAALVFPASIAAFRTAARVGDVDALDGLLTTVPHEDVVGGLLAAEAAWFAAAFGPAALVALGGVAVGTGSVALAAAGAVAVLTLGAVGVVAGFALGFGGRVLLSRSEVVARHRTALGASAFLAYVTLVVTGNVDSAVQPLLDVVRRSPVGWFADLALLPAAAGADPALAAVALLAAPPTVVALFAASAWFAGRYWYGDRARAPTDDAGPSAFERDLPDPLAGRLGRPTAAVARKAWLRALRAPIKLVYVAYPVFLLVGPIAEAVETGVVTAALGPIVALYGAWATGAAFTLNPLGDEGAVLPTTLTTPVSGRAFVDGLLAAGVAVGAPVTGALVLVVALLGPLGAAGVVSLVVVGLCLPVGAAALAAGAGTLFPKFETAAVTRSREAVVPSLYAFGLYSLAVSLAWLPTGVAVIGAEPLSTTVGWSPGRIAVAGALATVVLIGGAGILARRYAARRVDGYTL